MEKKKSDKLIPVFSAILAIVGIVFLCLSMFSEQKDNHYLVIGLAAIVVANIINVVKYILTRDKDDNPNPYPKKKK